MISKICLLLIALCFLAFANSLNNAFVSDDIPGILRNPGISHPLRFWLDPSSLLNSLNYLIAGYNPFIYHLTNIILHSLNTILVFFFLRLLFKKEAALLGACLFAVHPIHTEAVTWISGRPYIITSLFILIAYLLYYYSTSIKQMTAPSSSLRGGQRDSMSVIARSETTKPALPAGRQSHFRLLPASDSPRSRNDVLGLLSAALRSRLRLLSSLAMTAGGRIALYIISLLFFSYYLVLNFSFYFIFPLFLVFSDITFNRWRRTWKLWLPFLAILILRLLLGRNLIIQRATFVAQEVGMGGTLTNPIFNFAYSFFSHMGLILWPAKLTLYHEPAVISSFALKVELFFLFLLLISLTFIFKKAKELFFGLGIFVLFLAPTYSPVTISWLVAERYLYFPSIMLSIFLALFYEKITTVIANPAYSGVAATRLYAEGVKQSRLLRHSLRSFLAMTIKSTFARNDDTIPIILILIIAGFGVRTVARNEDWKTPERFWRQTALVSMNSHRAHNNMGDAYSQEGNYEGAIREFKKAIELKPDYADAYHNMANIYHFKGDLKEAVKFYKQAVALNPGIYESHFNLGIIYLNGGKFDLAGLELEKALELRPDDANARNALNSAKQGLKK